MKESTNILISDLEAKAFKSDFSLYHEVLNKARTGYYHSCKSPLSDPEQALILDLVKLGFYDLIIKAHSGAYETTFAEADVWLQLDLSVVMKFIKQQ
ncbi:MAG: hypothetical protein KME46_29915 [Brasilonema angustatum HA4187-MV1]|jgi:hypothetical protein|nr:hypothetical protein [Brasilonema angustatum HA4187-MV1]